ncbi:MAG TPA: TonB-dependent receptor [Bryobacteraceae bacterium]|nr:TonB-dependent receptor [Bryobacteraceae bacterium]
MISFAGRSFRLMLVVLVLGLLILTAEHPLLGQVDTGTIRGAITDASGRVIPGATVTIKEEQTGLTLTTVSGAAGSYVFSPVRIGTYTVAATFTGFQKVEHPHVVVNVQQNVVVDFTLVPGQVTSVVEVTAGAPLLQTQDASVGQVVGSHEINSLPLNGRNYTLLAQLTAGVTTTVQETRGLTSSGSFVANGVPSIYNNYILDGIDNNNNTVDFLNGTAYAVRPPVDAIAEFKVQTSSFSAEFGRAGGAVVNAVLKSGTNQFHGDAWEFLRNDALDGTDFFLNANGQSKGEYRRNQFGFTLGGPIYIPHVYKGKNKTFFFVDYEGTRIRQALPFTDSVPTVNENASNFSNFSDLITGQSGTQTDDLGRTYALGTVFDPATTRAVTAGVKDPVTGQVATQTGYVRDPFPNNLVPLSRIDPVAVKLLDLFPLPNRPGILNNYTSDPVKSDNTDAFDVRVDHNFTDRDQTFARVSFYSEPQVLPTPLGGLAEGASSFAEGNQSNDVLNVAWSETHMFSPTMVNEFRIGYHRIHTVRLQPFGNTGGLNQQYGIPGIPDAPPNGGLAQINISGLNQLGGHNNLPLNEINATAQFTENVSKQLGSHSLRMGVEYQRIKVGVLSSQFPHGYFVYSGQYTSVPNLNAGSTGIAQFVINPIASTVPNGIDNVGGANNVQISPLGQEDYRRPYYGTYIQDTWKATRKLTLNLGLRWEYYQLPADNFGAEANFLPGTPFAGAEYLIDSRRKSTPLSPSFTNTLQLDGIQLMYTNNYQLGTAQKTNFAPRIGFAYQLASKLVVRGGYGIFYGGIFNYGDGANLGNNYPFEFGLSFNPPSSVTPITPDNSIGTLENGLLHAPLNPALVNASGLNLRGVQYNLQTPYVQGVNFNIQYQLSPNQALTVGYVGSLGRHLVTTPGTNLPSEILPPSVNVQQYVPFPDFARASSYGTTDGNSFYHSAQVKFERRFSNGVSVLATYTWSRLRSDTQDILFSTPGYRAPNLAGFGIQGDYGLGDFDVRNAAHISGSYELPFGAGKHFQLHSFPNALFGGWSLSGLMTLQSGTPFTVGCSVATAAGEGCYSLLVPGQGIYTGARTVAHWINVNAFANPPAATAVGQTSFLPLGGAPTQAIGPPFHRGDVALSKQWRTSETTHLEFRAEFFNLTNTPNFAIPSSLSISNAKNFGQITATRDNPDDQREIQFGMKFYF